VWSPFLRLGRREGPSEDADEWRNRAGRFAVLEARVSALDPPPELVEVHSLTRRAMSESRETFELVARFLQTDAGDENVRAEALTAGDQGRRLWIAAVSRLRRHPCRLV
jgi:hypothetical protein